MNFPLWTLVTIAASAAVSARSDPAADDVATEVLVRECGSDWVPNNNCGCAPRPPAQDPGFGCWWAYRCRFLGARSAGAVWGPPATVSRAEPDCNNCNHRNRSSCTTTIELQLEHTTSHNTQLSCSLTAALNAALRNVIGASFQVTPEWTEGRSTSSSVTVTVHFQCGVEMDPCTRTIIHSEFKRVPIVSYAEVDRGWVAARQCFYLPGTWSLDDNEYAFDAGRCNNPQLVAAQATYEHRASCRFERVDCAYCPCGDPCTPGVDCFPTD
jgi:hypothetical protein